MLKIHFQVCLTRIHTRFTRLVVAKEIICARTLPCLRYSCHQAIVTRSDDMSECCTLLIHTIMTELHHELQLGKLACSSKFVQSRTWALSFVQSNTCFVDNVIVIIYIYIYICI
jgi:hypothetical protein